MASNDIIIDDDFCRSMGKYFSSQGEKIDNIVFEYVSILQDLRNRAIVSGDTAKALSSYIEYASKLKKQFGGISSVAKMQVEMFLKAVDESDQYLY